MGWILEFIGVIVGSAVIPITLAVTSAHVSPHYTTFAPPIGSVLALVSWLASTKGMYGEINISTTFENWPMFIGCLVSLTVPLLLWAAMRPFVRKPYDWDNLFLMIPLQPRPGDVSFTHDDDASLGLDWDPQELARASKMAKTVSAVLCLIFLVIIPFPLYGTGYIMSRKFFTGWTVVVFIWSWVAALMIWCMPVWQSRGPLSAVLKGVWSDVTGRRKPMDTATLETPETETVSVDMVGDGSGEKGHMAKEG
jgi:hypothetical protein